ncbi:CaiB/BaiF CoA-transferase family protein [Sphingomonas solaris]|uniref:CoA transferase n=1 Tax=Alterirhizorhabdus solaris TaxID=2529389 RepID=A0A558RCQ8_9SPHN|nr:CoA transferase [Sphingomonas solaris]TVV77265.1 CoA transferase [Sphingomonas solaris]
MTDATASSAAIDRPLSGMVVLDLLDDGIAGVTRIYAELGAEVIRPVPPRPAGDTAVPSRADLRRRIDDLGKTLVEAGDDTGLAAFANRSDLIVTGLRSPDIATLLRPDRRDATVVMTVSMFGAGSGYTNWQATDPVLHALTGELSRSGIEGRAPLLPPGDLALQCAMAQAAYVGMAALHAAQLTGRGDRIDVSLVEAAMQALDPGYGISGSATLGRAAVHLPPGRPVKGFQYPILPCADGDVRLCLLAPRQWQTMFRWMGEPAEFADPVFNNTAVRQGSAALLAALADFLADKTREELEREGAARGVPISGLNSLAECLDAPHLVERHAIATATTTGGADFRLPDGVIEIDGVRMSALAPPTTPPSPAVEAGRRSKTPPADPRRPLAGLKVLDLGVIVVGGEQSRLLADIGADVIKVESSAFPDGTRHSYLPTGLSVSFAAGHRNKRSLGLNLRHAEGKALFRRLAAGADVILSNFKPGTMESLGLGYDEMAAINPGIVMVESSAFGSTGPWAGRMGYGPLVRAAAGLTAQWRYADDPASYSDSITIYPDHVGARYGAIAVLALLTRRLRTGRGGRAGISQLEVMLSHFATDIAAASIGLAADGPPDAPWGVFRAAGEDQWCVVTVRHDGDWASLARVLDRPDWQGADLATAAQRRARRASIERDVAAWMAGQDADTAMHALQAAGVPAARMLRIADLPDFDYYRQRRFFRVDRHPHMNEPVVAERRHAVSQLLAEPDARPAPLMGEHSREVVREWLGLGEHEIDVLIREKVLETIDPVVARMVAAGEGRGPA